MLQLEVGDVASGARGPLRKVVAGIRATKEREQPMRTSLGAGALLAVSLGGCSTSLNVISDPFVAPAKFQFLRCEDIASRLVATQAREQELRGLMDRAGGGTGGSAVNVLVYQPDYQTVQSELRQLHEAAAGKQCPDAAHQADPKEAGPKRDAPKSR